MISPYRIYKVLRVSNTYSSCSSISAVERTHEPSLYLPSDELRIYWEKRSVGLMPDGSSTPSGIIKSHQHQFFTALL